MEISYSGGVRMRHTKTFYSVELETKNGTVLVEGPVQSEQLATYTLHEDLIAFRPSKQQHEALVEIAKLRRRPNYYHSPR